MFVMFAICSFALSGPAQVTPQTLAGDWSGSLSVGGSSLPLVLHLKIGPGGEVAATLDSPAQGASGLACSNVLIAGSTLNFDVPSVHGSYSGRMTADGKTLFGTWTQGKSLPLIFKQTASAAELASEKPSPIDGDWAGVLHAGDVSLRTVFHFRGAPGDKIDATLDSLDQGAMGIPCANVELKGQELSLDVPTVHGSYSGKLSADSSKISGTWTQGAPLPLELTRQPKAAPSAPPVPASAPVGLKDLQPILEKEFAPVIAAWPQGGIVLGVLDHGERKVLAYGSAKPDSIFEIGSVTKTFTALALAQMVEQHAVTLDEPVRDLLPPGVAPKPSGPEITLLDLATQHSGLPRLPDNLKPKSQADPYADYTAKDLYAFLKKRGVSKEAKPEYLYSNLGFGLLGQALADKAKHSYQELIRQQVTGPLGMNDTAVLLSAAQQQRFIQGYTGSHDKARPWTFDAMAGAGALRSTADDLLTYCAAYLHPDTASGAGPAATLPAALRLGQQPQATGPGTQKIALAWMIRPEQDAYWHDGGTYGFSSMVMFEPKRDRALVVLFNCFDLTPGKQQLVNRVAANVIALIDGKAVPPIAD